VKSSGRNSSLVQLREG